MNSPTSWILPLFLVGTLSSCQNAAASSMILATDMQEEDDQSTLTVNTCGTRPFNLVEPGDERTERVVTIAGKEAFKRRPRLRDLYQGEFCEPYAGHEERPVVALCSGYRLDEKRFAVPEHCIARGNTDLLLVFPGLTHEHDLQNVKGREFGRCKSFGDDIAICTLRGGSEKSGKKKMAPVERAEIGSLERAEHVEVIGHPWRLPLMSIPGIKNGDTLAMANFNHSSGSLVFDVSSTKPQWVGMFVGGGLKDNTPKCEDGCFTLEACHETDLRYIPATKILDAYGNLTRGKKIPRDCRSMTTHEAQVCPPEEP